MVSGFTSINLTKKSQSGLLWRGLEMAEKLTFYLDIPDLSTPDSTQNTISHEAPFEYKHGKYLTVPFSILRISKLK